jgi:hypothetical protein
MRARLATNTARPFPHCEKQPAAGMVNLIVSAIIKEKKAPAPRDCCEGERHARGIYPRALLREQEVLKPEQRTRPFADRRARRQTDRVC